MKKNTRSNRAITVGAALVGTAVMVASALPSLGGINQPGQRTHLVKEGESLWTIAKRELGSGLRWYEIYQLNRHWLKNPARIFPHQTIILPGRTVFAEKKAKKTQKAPVAVATPSALPTVLPTETPMPVSETPSPVPTESPTIQPTSVPEPIKPSPSARPKFSAKVGYWASNNETSRNFFGTNNGALAAQLEWMPLSDDQAIGFSGAGHTFPAGFSSGIWDAYYRTGMLKVGYRSDDLLRRTIPAGSAVKQDLHSESIITGLAFGVPLREGTFLDFDLLGGSTFHNVAVGTSERVLTDLGATFRTRVGYGLDLNLGYRSYVFGTFGDLRNLYTGKSGRTAAFGSYQGPTAGVSLRF